MTSDGAWQDRAAIAQLVNLWMYRDLGRWDELLDLFHPDATIEVAWFEGRFVDFVEGSKKMGSSDIRSKHFIGNPLVTFNGSRAIAETNAMIVGDNPKMRLGYTSHNRFYDWVERREGRWKILKRQSIYDMCGFNYPCGIVDVDRGKVDGYPSEYSALAYVVEASGFPIKRVFPIRNSDQEAGIRSAGEAWLAAAEDGAAA